MLLQLGADAEPVERLRERLDLRLGPREEGLVARRQGLGECAGEVGVRLGKAHSRAGVQGRGGLEVVFCSWLGELVCVVYVDGSGGIE